MPGPNIGVARQYAEAAFQLADETNAFDLWLGQLQASAEALMHPRALEIFDNPAISVDDKMAIIRRSLADVDPMLLNLIFLLVKRRRLPLLVLVRAELARLVDERRGIVLAEVTTAVPLDDRESELVQHRLSAVLGKQVQMRAAVDPEIIGGLVVKVGDRLINGSVAGRLASLRRELV
ncbi:MAG: F0F1 ATP synthase subunit delta [Chloroflexota bacterium]